MTTHWNRPVQIFLSVLVALQIIPLISIVPIWVSVVGSALVVLKFLHLLRGVPLPPQKWITLIGALGLIGVYFTKGTLIGEDAATAGLVVIAGCKLIEANRYRDVLVTIVLCFILLMAQLLFSQSLATMVFLVVDVLLLVQLFLQLHPSETSLFSFRTAGRLLLMVVPVWVLLFTVFPRFTVGFWKREVPISQTGFSEEMNPGAVGRVVESDELAFRVQFDELKMRPEEVYWRGSILSVADGLHWTKTQRRLPLETGSVVTAGSAVQSLHYELFLEPLFQRWLFTLDYYDPQSSIAISGQAINRLNGGISEMARPLTSRVTYRASAVREPLHQFKLTDLERQTYLQLPGDLDKGVQDLAKQLRAPDGSTTESVRRMSDWFQSQKFFYSLSPGSVPNLNAFLFDKKVGFCEHYAGAAGVLLRAMGYPARVVIGFQGADRNEFGDYWIVRNRNAHAWTEVWVQERSGNGGRWQRVDLVSVVMPMRMTLGADYFRLAAQLPVSVAQLTDEQIQELSRSCLGKLQSRVALAFDALEMKWIRFLLAYDFEFQKRLISRLGIQNASRTTFFAILAGLLAVAFLLLVYFSQRKQDTTDPLAVSWKRLCDDLARQGLVRRPSEGPRDFIERAKLQFPDQALQLAHLGQSYLALRYEGAREGDTSSAVKKFIQSVAQYGKSVRRSRSFRHSSRLQKSAKLDL